MRFIIGKLFLQIYSLTAWVIGFVWAGSDPKRRAMMYRTYGTQK